MIDASTNIVFLDYKTFLAEELDLTKLTTAFPNCIFYEDTSNPDVAERMRSAEIVICNKAVIDKECLKIASNLRMISITATGYNNVDIQEAKKRNVVVTNVRSYAQQSVAQHVFTLIFSLATKINDYTDLVDKGKWNTSKNFCLLDFKISEMHGKTLGLIGYGDLGKEVVRVANCFGMKTLIAERKGVQKTRPDRVLFEDVLHESDVISIHCPLNSETENLIDTKELKSMKKTSLLINTARGGIVNEIALRDALISGDIGGAGIDVLSEEPPINGNVLLDKNIPNLILTPHIAWATVEAQQRLIDKAVDNIISFLQGDAINIVS